MIVNSGGGTVDFQEFVGGLSAFSSRGGREEKLRCSFPLPPPCPTLANRPLLGPAVAFKVYDVDRDGFISNGELFLVLKMMVGNNLKVSSPASYLVPAPSPLAPPLPVSLLCVPHNRN